MEQFEKNIIDHVDSVGWSVIKVAPESGGDDPDEWFAYTIGLSKTFGWPELICFGLDLADMHQILNQAVEECRRRDISPTLGTELIDVLKGFPARLTEGDHISERYFGYALWFARQYGETVNLRRLQLVWPDAEGRFPDDPDCEVGVRLLQTPCETVQ